MPAPSLTIQQLLTPPTAAQVRAQWVSNLVTLGVPADKWRAGGVWSTILTVLSNVYAAFALLITAGIGSFFLPTAFGGWLDLLAYYVYGVLRVPATFATGNVSLINGGGGSFTLNPGDLIVSNPTTGATYTNVAGFTLTPLGTVSIVVSAVTAGSGGSSAPGTITGFVTPLTNVTVTNPSSLVGTDAQTDASLQQTCLNKLASLGVPGGLANAYAFAATTALNGTVLVAVNRVQVTPASSTGTVGVVVAGPSGAVSGTVNPPTGDLGAVLTNILAIARPQAVTVNLSSAVPQADTDALTVYARASVPGVSQAQLQANVAAAISLFLSTYPIGGLNTAGGGGFLYATDIIGIAASADPRIFAVTGAADKAMASNVVITDSISVTVVMV